MTKATKNIIVLILVILGVAFYWYEWRPSQIKIECSEIAKDKAIELSKTKAEILDKDIYQEAAERNMYNRDDYDEYYRNCLREKGL